MDSQRYEMLMDAFMRDAVARMQELLDARVVLETAPADGSAWDHVRRAGHTIAGNAAMMGFDTIAKAARSMERRAIAVAERGGVPDDVWTLDGEWGTLERLIGALDADAPRSDAAA